MSHRLSSHLVMLIIYIHVSFIHIIIITCCLLSQTEVNFLGQLRHPNLVKLIGYCCEEDHRLLVYEFMFRGSLENHLFRSMKHLLSLFLFADFYTTLIGSKP